MTLSCYQCITYIWVIILILQLIFIGPFKVIKCVGKLAYCIDLPPIYSALYNVFHVFKLKLYILGGGDGTSTNV